MCREPAARTPKPGLREKHDVVLFRSNGSENKFLCCAEYEQAFGPSLVHCIYFASTGSSRIALANIWLPNAIWLLLHCKWCLFSIDFYNEAIVSQYRLKSHTSHTQTKLEGIDSY